MQNIGKVNVIPLAINARGLTCFSLALLKFVGASGSVNCLSDMIVKSFDFSCKPNSLVVG